MKENPITEENIQSSKALILLREKFDGYLRQKKLKDLQFFLVCCQMILDFITTNRQRLTILMLYIWLLISLIKGNTDLALQILSLLVNDFSK